MELRGIRISDELLERVRKDIPQTEIHPEIINPKIEYGQHPAIYVEIRSPSEFDIERKEPPRAEYEQGIVDMN